jgi:outer membrane biosynthesis protein TonB
MCYDIARVKDPNLKGKLTVNVNVNVNGNKVDAAIVKNELTPALAACVIRAIKSIKPPPNTGDPMAIEKELEFKISGF